MEEEEYDEDFYEDDEPESEPLRLVIGEDGKADIKRPEDFVEMTKEDMDLIQGFLKENKKKFTEYCKSKEKENG